MCLQVLASLHLAAERVRPSRVSTKQAREVRAVKDWGRGGNLSEAATQRDLSLVATWAGLLRRIASNPKLEGQGFACIFEDGVALHEDVTHSVARRAILHGMDLARTDGLLSLGSCGPPCWDTPSASLQHVEFRKCDAPCSHGVCVTKQKSGTLMSEMRGAWQDNIMKYNYQSTEGGHCLDQMLRVYAEHYSSVWTVGTNLWALQWVWYGDQLSGLFHQDSMSHEDGHWPSTRCARGRWHGIVGATTPGDSNLGKGQAGLFDWLY